jgi:hypothetical protein
MTDNDRALRNALLRVAWNCPNGDPKEAFRVIEAELDKLELELDQLGLLGMNLYAEKVKSTLPPLPLPGLNKPPGASVSCSALLRRSY